MSRFRFITIINSAKPAHIAIAILAFVVTTALKIALVTFNISIKGIMREK
jgi:hypothetical protein